MVVYCIDWIWIIVDKNLIENEILLKVIGNRI